jgi:phage-related protein
MLTLSAGAIAEKDKLASDSAWPVLLEIQIPGDQGYLYLTNNSENVTWNGQVWQAFPFGMDPIRENTGSELPQLTIRVSNVSRDVLYYLEQAGGAIDFPVVVRVVNTEVLGGSVAEAELEYVVKRITYDAQWVTFTLGGSQHIARRTPDRCYRKDVCPFAYGGIECGVSAATLVTYQTCDHGIVHCRERGNSARFGGEQGIPTGGWYARI